MPTQIMSSRSPHGGSFRPILAPSCPPMIDPAAISPAAPQSMCVAITNTTAAIPLTSPARQFLTALMRCMVSVKATPISPSSSTPWAAPKYPP
jgi:hypothetical protein